MNKNRRNVILQAPFGVGCVVMVASPSIVRWGRRRAEPMLATGLPALQLNIWARTPESAAPAAIETVISRHGLAMLNANQRDFPA
jgi:hypothetical protein